jgi:transcriptional regulator with XRE-family HTH domain
MKSATRLNTAKRARLGTLQMTDGLLSSSLSVTTRDASTNLRAPSRQRISGWRKFAQEPHRQYLSKSMEKTFLRMRNNAVARDAYVQAEVVTALTHQIRSIRMQRGWSQKDLAQRLGTTQAAVSRLEDPSYGRFSVKTLFDLSRVFDTGLQVSFVSFVTMLADTFKPSFKIREVPSFEEEAPTVAFFTERPSVVSLDLPVTSQESTSFTRHFLVKLESISRNAATNDVSIAPLVNEANIAGWTSTFITVPGNLRHLSGQLKGQSS